MSLYSQMESIPGPSSQADEPVQRQLKSLLRQLNWSYVALWTFNHQTSRLEWRGGHSAVTGRGGSEVWNEHLFNSTYKSCTFAPGEGCVGTAFSENRSIWMNGPSILHSAGSKEQAQILQHAGVETAVCIPWAQISVLELGTRETMAENLDLTAYMSEHILPFLAASRATIQSDPFPSLNPIRHLSSISLNQESELDSLNEQIRRSSSLSSLNTDMMFLQFEEGEAGEETGIELTDPRWRSPPPPMLGAADFQLQTQRPPLPIPNQVLMSARVQHSGTTSSSVSISEDGSVRLSPSPRRGTPSHSPEVQIGDTSIASGIIAPNQNLRSDDEIQQAFSHLLEEGEAEVDVEEQWRNMYMNQALELGNVVSEMNLLDSSTMPSMSAFHAQDEPPRPAFQIWRRTRVQAPVLRSTNQALLRRCIAMLRQITNLQRGIRPDAAVVHSNISLQGPRLTSSSTSPKALLDIGIADHPSDQTGPSRGERRLRRAKSATTGPFHDEAAMNHMMAERRRRTKQKENFSALRKLVPIISKADKASILGDAIVYIKDLQEKIREMESSREEIESRYEGLKKVHQELEQRNKELQTMVAERDGAGTSQMQQQRAPRQHPTRQSF